MLGQPLAVVKSRLKETGF